MLPRQLHFLSIAILITQSVAAPGNLSTEPCALVQSAWAASPAAATNGSSSAQFAVDASTAYACLQSVPLDKANATAVMDGLAAFWSFHSTQAWLKDPTPAYPIPGVDLIGGLASIRASVENGTMSGEYQFQSAINKLIYEAADGHFTYRMDLLTAFTFHHYNIGAVVAVSEDGLSLPLAYYTFDDLQTTPADSRSSIVSINGQPAAVYFDSIRSHALYADPDAQLAYTFGDIARMDSQQYSGLFRDGRAGLYFGNSTTLTFANGSEHTYQNLASVTGNWRNVDSGAAFYREFCSPPNMTAEYINEFINHSGGEDEPAVSAGSVRPHYPSSPIMDKAGTVAGYFLNGTNSDTAILSITSFATGEAPTQDAQITVQNFLAACRKTSKTRLIIDISSNNGGNSLLPFDFFKQLFPTLAPYNVQVARAHAGYNLLGTAVSTSAAQLKSSGANITQYVNNGGFSSYDVADFTAPNTSSITWPELYGPNQYHDDNFTNLFGRRYFQTNYSEVADDLVVSGYGARSNLAPQVFKSEDILLLTNGACDSACALFAHFMKYQGKVKSLTLGGRPQTGPMQAVGGTRGTQVETFFNIWGFTKSVQSLATPEIAAAFAQTELTKIAEVGAYVLSRAISPMSPTLNLYNHIAQGDMSLTPLQFTYEAADCRLFYTAETAVDISASWAKAADVWKAGFNNRTCVAGSTGQPSSLSGNAGLYDGAMIANASTSEIPGNIPASSLMGNGTNVGGQVPAVSAGVRTVAQRMIVVLVSLAGVVLF